MVILARQKKFINLYKIINITRIQMLNLSLHIGHKKVQWSKYLSLFIVGFRAGLVLLNLDYAILYLRRAFSFINKVLYFYGRLFSISNFVNVGFGGLSQYFLNKRRKGLVGHYDGYYMGGLVSNFFKIRRAKKRFKFEFVRKFVRFRYRLPSIFFIFDANEHFLCYKEASFVGIPSVGFLDSDLDYQHALYPIIANDESIIANIYILLVVSYFVKVNRYKRRLKFFKLFLKFFIILIKYCLFFHIIDIGSYVKFRSLMLEKRAFDMYGYLYNWGKRPYTLYVHNKIPDMDIKKLQDSIFMYQSQVYDEYTAPSVWKKSYLRIYKFLLWFLARKRFRYKRYRRWLLFFYKNYTPAKTQASNFGTKFLFYYEKILAKYEYQNNQAWVWNNNYRVATYPRTLHVQDMFVKRLFRPVFFYKFGFFLRLVAFRYGFDLLAQRIFRIFNKRHGYKQVFRYLGNPQTCYLFYDEIKAKRKLSKLSLHYRDEFDYAWKDFWDVRKYSKYMIFTIVFYLYRAYIFDMELFFFSRRSRRQRAPNKFFGFWFNNINKLKPGQKRVKAIYGRYHYSRRRFWRYTSVYFFYFVVLFFWVVFLRKYKRRVVKRRKKNKLKKWSFYLYNFETGTVKEHDIRYKKLKKKTSYNKFKKRKFLSTRFNKNKKKTSYNKFKNLKKNLYNKPNPKNRVKIK